MIFDILCLLIAIYLIYGGFKSGFVKESLKLTKYFIVIYIIYKFKNVLPVFKGYVESLLNYKINDIVIYILLFILLFFVLTVIANILTKILETVGLGSLNKTLGLIVSSLKAIIIIYIMYVALVLVSPYSNFVYSNLMNSKVADFIEQTTSKSIYNMLPSNLKLRYIEYYEKKEKDKSVNYVYESIKEKN